MFNYLRLLLTLNVTKSACIDRYTEENIVNRALSAVGNIVTGGHGVVTDLIKCLLLPSLLHLLDSTDESISKKTYMILSHVTNKQGYSISVRLLIRPQIYHYKNKDLFWMFWIIRPHCVRNRLLDKQTTNSLF